MPKRWSLIPGDGWYSPSNRAGPGRQPVSSTDAAHSGVGGDLTGRDLSGRHIPGPPLRDEPMAPDEQNVPIRVGDNDRHDLEWNADHVVIDPRAVRELDVCELQPKRCQLIVEQALALDLPPRSW